jgi:3'(2'), 5'-bisphosphate nucleotidase
MYIAEGKSDYYPRKGTTMEWDTAAAEIILIESGATIVQLENGQPLEYNKPDLRNPYFVAQGKLFEN